MHVVAVYNTERGRGFFPYSESHVESLRAQLARFGHALVTIGLDVPILRKGYAGWWSKMLVFAPEYRELRPMLALDLDNFVVDTLDPILALDPTKLWLIRQFMSRTDLAEMGLCIVPDAPLADTIWHRAEADPQTRQPGELVREFPYELIPDAVDGIYSYKRDCRQSCPPDARVVCFHGKPKPPDVEGWARQWWDNSLS